MKGARGQDRRTLEGWRPLYLWPRGEEAEELVAAGIDFEVVPGITSAIAVVICRDSLTHRDYTSAWPFSRARGDDKDTWRLTGPRWLQAWDAGVLMGVGNLPFLSGKLMEHGRPADTP